MDEAFAHRRSTSISRLLAGSASPAARRTLTIALGAASLAYLTLAMSVSGALLVGDPRAVPSSGAFAAAVVIVVAQAAACAFRRRNPVASFLAVALGVVLLTLLLDNRTIAAVPLYWFALCSLAVHVKGPTLALTAMAGAALDVGAQIRVLAADPVTGFDPWLLDAHDLVTTAAGPVVNVVVSYAVCIGGGVGIGGYRRRMSRLRQDWDALEQARHHQVEESVAAERRRMARELHDVAAHHLTGLIVQSKAARRVQRTSPDLVPPLLDEIITQAQSSLTSLREIVGLLRLDPSPAVLPQPVVVDITELVEEARRGLPLIELVLHGRFDDVHEAVQLSCYRIVQESLSNVLRHAPDTEVRVEVARTDRRVVVDVVNSAPGRAGSETRPGFGITGMRERAEHFGGVLEAGPTELGGWRVHAELNEEGAFAQ